MTDRPAKHADPDAIDATGSDRVDGRRARSQRTSSRLLATSRELFLEQGYVRTSMEEIATRAGVSEQTVFNQFGTKCDLLAAVLDRAIVGDAAPVSVIERDWFAVREDEPAPEVIARFAAAATALFARVAPLYDVIRSASALPEVNRLLADNRRRRRADQRHIVRALAAAGKLHPDLDARHAADVVYGLMNEDVYLLLTADCRWSRKRFTTWLTETLLDQLVALPTPQPVRRGRPRSG
jgi:AcrR family transcriptional regulator